MKKNLRLLLMVFALASTSTILWAQDDTTITRPAGSQILAFGEPKVIDTDPDWYNNKKPGWLIADAGAEYSGLLDVAAWRDGRMVIIGNTRFAYSPMPFRNFNTPTLIGVTRFGKIDESFGRGGIVQGIFSDNINNVNGEFTTGVTQAEGKLVVIGTYIEQGEKYLLSGIFTRYNKDGSLDKTFKTGPKVKSQGYNYQDLISSEIRGGRGSLYLLSTRGDRKLHLHFRVEKYDRDGNLDTRWGDRGSVEYISPDSTSSFRKMAMDSKGRIVLLAGPSGGDRNYVTKMVRLLPDGKMDNSFGDGGFVVHQAMSDYMTCMVIDANNRIITGGSIQDTVLTGTGGRYGVKRFKEDGSPDLNFNKGVGYNRWDLGDQKGLYRFYDIMLQGGDGGQIIAIGEYTLQDKPAGFNFIARYKSDGTVDMSFGDSGKVQNNIYYRGRVFTAGYYGAVVDDGKALIVASQLYAGYDHDKAQFFASALTKYNLLPKKINIPGDSVAAADAAAVIANPGETIASVRPNPTRNSATIAFNLDQRSTVNVRIVDMNGRTVTTVYTGTLSKGGQVMQADMSRLPPGMYNVVLQTGSKTKSMKLVKE